MSSRPSTLWWILCGGVVFGVLVGLLGVSMIPNPATGLIPLVLFAAVVAGILYWAKDRI